MQTRRLGNSNLEVSALGLGCLAVSAIGYGAMGGFMTGSDFLMDGGVTASYWYGEVVEVRGQ